MIISSAFEYYALTNDSKLTKINPLTKTIILFVYLFLNISFQGYQYLALFLISLFLFYLAKVKISYVIKALLMACILSVIMFFIKFYLWKSGGFVYSLVSSLRIISGLLLILSYVATTPLNKILVSLKTLKVPDIFLETFLMIYRYIFVINDDSLKLRDAQMVRLGYKDFKTSIKSMGTLWGALFLKSITRAERIVDALNTRGYNGKIFYHTDVERLQSLDIAIIILLGCIPLFIVLSGMV